MQDAPAGTLRTIPGPHGCIHVSHTGTGAPLAMKRFNAVGNEFLHHRALEVSQAVYRWQAVAARQHPNIYPVYGIRNRDSVSFAIDMPYSAEGNLMNYITNNPQTARLALVEQIATGLEYLHRNGLVHGNLKPSNVLMEQERAKLTDIGITAALQLEDLRNPRKTVQLPSDWMYNAADEILRIDLNDPMPVMQGRDVYAFAHTVYELYTGRTYLRRSLPLARRITAVEAGMAQAQRPPQIPDKLWKVLQHCWAWDTTMDRVVGMLRHLN